MENLISLKEYAELYGVTPDTVRQKVLRGGFTTVRKIGRNWVIDAGEPYDDKRSKGGIIKVKNIKKAVEESMNSTYGYFMYNTKTNEVAFQPTLNADSLPDTDEWQEHERYLGRVYEFSNAKEREREIYYLIEALKEEN